MRGRDRGRKRGDKIRKERRQGIGQTEIKGHMTKGNRNNQDNKNKRTQSTERGMEVR